MLVSAGVAIVFLLIFRLFASSANNHVRAK
jgi:hypothetical protein